MAWTIVDPPFAALGAQPVTEKSTSQQHPLGLEVTAIDPTWGYGRFTYVKGVASAEKNEWCTLDLHNSGTIVRLAANAKGMVGITKTTLTASYYGWIQRGGIATGQCLTQFADNGKVFITGTAGAVDDASVAGDLVSGAVGRSLTVVDSGIALFELDRPFVTDADS